MGGISGWLRYCFVFCLLVSLTFFGSQPIVTQAAEKGAESKKPIKIGCSLALSGALAGAGKQALLSYRIFIEDINKKGGVLGRPVELVYYDDHTKPSDIPAIYTKLITVDKVDFVVGPYGTGLVAASLPVVMEHKMCFPSLYAVLANRHFKYDRYFQWEPHGGKAYQEWPKGFLLAAAEQMPKPKTIALLAVDNEYGTHVQEGAIKTSKELGFEVVYNKTYPPGTVDFSGLIRAMKATNPDLVYFSTYPPGTSGVLKTAKEVGLTPKMIGGAMIGAAYTSIQTDLGKALEGVTAITWWAPEPTMKFPGISNFLKQYQPMAKKEKLDPLGYYLAPYAYACLQVLCNAIEKTNSLDQKVVSDYLRNHAHESIVGKVEWDEMGEWKNPRHIWFQFQNIKGNKPKDFEGPGHLTIIYPEEYKSGKLVYPFPGWK
jgi:branched-chain amino acid transport system substrate-binding protein